MAELLHRADEIDYQREKMYKDFNKEDPHTSWVLQPHTITVLIIGVAVGTYVAFTRDGGDMESNAKIGISAVCLMFLLFSALQMRDGIFYRPHPMLWRTMMGLAVLYLCILVFMLFQNVDDVRTMMHRLDSRLGVPLPERSYAENCDLYTPDDKTSKFRNLMDTINDEFVIAHLLGWWGKSILLRDYWLCWFMSVLFEIFEYTFQHMLPNFKECWWDHLIVDIIVCNWVGFSLGFRVMKFFKMKEYKFVDEYHWEILTNWKRMLYVIFLVFVVSVIELNAFFLKFILYVAPPHPLNTIRLFMWWGIGMPGVREYYHWIIDKNCKRLGPMAWLCCAVALTETLIIFKFGRGMFPAEHPKEVIYPWVAFAVIFTLWFIWYYGFHLNNTSVSKDHFLVKGNNSTEDTNEDKKNSKKRPSKKDQ